MILNFPDHWYKVSLSDITLKDNPGNWGKEYKKFLDSSYWISARVIRATDLAEWSLQKAEYAAIRVIDKFTLEEKSLITGDILIEISGGGPTQHVGRVIYIDDEALNKTKSPLFYSNFFRMIRVDLSVIDSKYLYYYFSYFYSENLFEKYQKSSNNLRNFNYTLFKDDFSIYLPPKKEQSLIVKKLEAIFNDLNLIKVKLQGVSQKLSKFRRSALHNAISGKLTESWRSEKTHQTEYKTYDNIGLTIPSSWKIKNLAEVCSNITDGDHQSPPRTKTGIPFIVISNIKDGKIDFTDVDYVSEEYFNKLPEYRKPQTNDVLISVVGTLGTAVIVDSKTDFTFQRHIALLRPNERLSAKYLYYLINSTYFINEIKRNAKGDAQLTLNLTNLRLIEIPLPTREEQDIIVEKIESFFEVENKIKDHYAVLQKRYNYLGNVVLKEALEGGVTEKLPQEETLEYILEHIKTKKLLQENELKALNKQQFQEKQNMAKKSKEISKLDIEDILENIHEPVSAKEIWESSKYQGDIDSFYQAVKEKIASGTLTWAMREIDSETPESILALNTKSNEN